jgi:hypothetical protein
VYSNVPYSAKHSIDGCILLHRIVQPSALEGVVHDSAPYRSHLDPTASFPAGLYPWIVDPELVYALALRTCVATCLCIIVTRHDVSVPPCRTTATYRALQKYMHEFLADRDQAMCNI